MKPELFTKVLLDKPWRIRFSNRSRYRLQTLDKTLEFDEIGKSDRSFAALCQWLWACMDEENPFTTPEDLAEVVDLNRAGEIAQALIDCVTMGNPKDAKNESSSTPSPSPVSSSG